MLLNYFLFFISWLEKLLGVNHLLQTIDILYFTSLFFKIFCSRIVPTPEPVEDSRTWQLFILDNWTAGWINCFKLSQMCHIPARMTMTMKGKRLVHTSMPHCKSTWPTVHPPPRYVYCKMITKTNKAKKRSRLCLGKGRGTGTTPIGSAH